MPHFFSESSVAFLERYQFIPRRREGRHADKRAVPTDGLSLMDVMLHTNSIFTIFFRLRKMYGHAEEEEEVVVGRMVSSTETEMENLSHMARHLQADMADFDVGLSEEVLAPTLLSFLDFYLDHSTTLTSLHQTLRAFFETTPYISELEDNIDTETPFHSNIALLFFKLAKALLYSQTIKYAPLEVSNEVVTCEPPLLPWLYSIAEYTTVMPTWYWRTAQHPRTTCLLIKKVKVHRGRSNNNNNNSTSSSSCKDIINNDEDAITFSHLFQRVPRKRCRIEYGFDISSTGEEHIKDRPAYSPGILPLPYDVQKMILEYLSPRALSAAISVCVLWRRLIRRSATMCFYLRASHIITREFFKFMRDDWGQAWIRVNELTTVQRLNLNYMLLGQFERHLQQWRESIPSLEDFVIHLYNERGPKSCEWKMLEGMWSAIEMEIKIFPFMALRNAEFPTLLYNGSSTCLCGKLSQMVTLSQLRQLLLWMRCTERIASPLLVELAVQRSLLLGAANQSPPTTP
ncbi:uncharacterized protein TM35_000292150 [Trypanosoma theileri]|uniref:F-box domain-containing protein n=1 Tax=Trypanosoma theileri TaxID=67003 RepID=A0A1X0NPC2_9TRYP|nr:uncharacterized protein TM35_000292150 [Trypanosoma theileri]ORC86333.1 hypothetical protein TM35_000292150 [Trypanosoma theileri]